MYEDNLTFKMIKMRIGLSYDTFMDDTHGERDIHYQVLEKRFNPDRFGDVTFLDKEIHDFLHELQEEVDMEVSSAQYGFLNELEEGEE